MNKVSAQEIKRRSAIAALTHPQKHKSEESLLTWMLSKPATGKKSADNIATQLKLEREAWDKRSTPSF